MADIWNKRKRSTVMSLIRSHGNKATEIRLIEIFRAHRITGWRRRRKLIGSPDFVFGKRRVCIFVDGCFWHGCGKCYRRPDSNRKYWDDKFHRNRARDRQVNRRLKGLGWTVLRIWEHELTGKNEARLVARIRKRV